MKFFPVIVATLILGSVAKAQTPAQQSAARSVFDQFRSLNEAKKLNTAPARALVMDEATAYIQHAQLGPMSKPDAFLFPDASHAVARVQGLGETGKPVVDVYFYLSRSGPTWKVSALRSLSLTGLVGEARDQLERKPKLSPAEREELANLRLTLALDADLRRHFVRNRAAFARLSTIKRQPLSPTETAKLKRQLAFDPNQSDDGDGFECVIGGILDNTVGYGFSPSGRLPAINNRDYIWVERLSPQWYLFRTT